MSRKSDLDKAREAIIQYLKDNSNEEKIPLFTISVIAEMATGKELYSYLYDYENLVEDMKRKWDLFEGNDTYIVINPFYNKNKT